MHTTVEAAPPRAAIRIEVRYTTGDGEAKSARMTLGFLADFIAKIYGAGGFLTSVSSLPP